ncbi:MAG: hypothetical protein ACKVP4_12030 [Hyphomicrobium sp.]
MLVSDRPSNSMDATFESPVPRHTPDDSFECIFLGRAYHEIAKAVFPDWSGNELTLTLPDILPDAIEPRAGLLTVVDNAVEAEWYEPPSRKQLDYAYDLLHVYRPDLRERSRTRGFFSGWGMPAPRFSLFEWKLAQKFNLEHHERVKEGLGKKWYIDKTISCLCEANILRTRLRHPEGGDFSDVLPASYWRTENYGERFKTWCMHPERPFTASGFLHFIFVERASLAVALIRLMGNARSTNDGDLTGFVSDQVSFLLSVAARCGVTADEPLTIEAIAAQIVQDWPWVDKPGKTEVRYMASIIRNRSAREEAWKRKGKRV